MWLVLPPIEPAQVAHGVKALSQMYAHAPHTHGFRQVSYGSPKGVAGLRLAQPAAAAAASPKPDGTLYAASPEFQKLTQAQSLDLGVPDNVNGTQIFDSSVAGECFARVWIIAEYVSQHRFLN